MTRTLVAAARWLLFLIDTPPLPEPGTCAASIEIIEGRR